MKTEKELAQVVIKLFSEKETEVFQEVKSHFNNCRADIVFITNKIIHIVECKLNPSIQVLGQCVEWIKHSNYVSVVFLKRERITQPYIAFLKVANELGIGVISVAKNTHFVHLSPKYREIKPGKSIKRFLSRGHQGPLSVAGSKHQYYTRFKQTCFNLTTFVNKNPGLDYSTVISSIDHHYKNDIWAKKNLEEYILSGHIKVRFEIDVKGKINLYPTSHL